MPLGSSSAAPVMIPGPRRLLRLVRDTGFKNATITRRLRSQPAERPWSVEVTDIADVRHQAGTRTPLMKRDRGRLHHHREVRVLVQVEGRLMGGARRDRRHGAGPARLDRPMDMA